MAEWEPISIDELFEQLHKGEAQMEGELLNFWQLIKINPVKWSEKDFGNESGGFWVVAICGSRVIWYNDIEEGFNISNYAVWGEIQGYYCNQDEIKFAVMRLFELVKLGGEITGQLGAPEALN